MNITIANDDMSCQITENELSPHEPIVEILDFWSSREGVRVLSKSISNVMESSGGYLIESSEEIGDIKLSKTSTDCTVCHSCGCSLDDMSWKSRSITIESSKGSKKEICGDCINEVHNIAENIDNIIDKSIIFNKEGVFSVFNNNEYTSGCKLYLGKNRDLIIPMREAEKFLEAISGISHEVEDGTLYNMECFICDGSGERTVSVETNHQIAFAHPGCLEEISREIKDEIEKHHEELTPYMI